MQELGGPSAPPPGNKDRRDKTVLQKWRCVHHGPP